MQDLKLPLTPDQPPVSIPEPMGDVAADAASSLPEAAEPQAYSVEYFQQKFNLSTPKLIELGVYFGVGFGAGLLFKRYSTYALAFLAVIGIAVWWLEGAGILTIDWLQLKAVFGLGAQDTFDTLFASTMTVIRERFAQVVTGFIGFVLGYRLS